MRENPYRLFSASELMAIIDDTIFEKNTDRDIAIDMFVKSFSEYTTACNSNYSTKTISRRLPKIEERINFTIQKH